MRSVFSRVSSIVPYALLGPISGPLALGMVRSARDRRWLMATVYAVAMVEAWALMAAASVYLGTQAIRFSV
jgi:hypothetical protein